MRNSLRDSERYNEVAVFLHWAIALCIIAMIPLGFFMEDLPIEIRFQAFALHKSIGITVLALSVFRLIWRLMNTPPSMPETLPAREKMLARAAHWLFYALIIAMPLSGWLMVSTTQKYPTVFFGLGEVPFIPMPSGLDVKTAHGQLKDIHEWLAFLAIFMVVVHVAAALRHHYRLSDNTLRRMLPLWLQKRESL